MARLVFTLEDGTEIESELDKDVISIGRHPECSIILPSPSVSAQHASIKRRGDSFYVQDLATTNGTRLNGVEVEEAKLEEGDRLSFGDVPAILYLGHATDKKNIGTELADKNKANEATARAKPTPPTAIYPQSSGCAGLFFFMAFLTVALLTGLSLRHWKEHGGFLPKILVERIGKKNSDSELKPEGDHK